ncbi:GAF and ANTAR domain-containing protein [Actinosynnema sp. NPDC020468]|uniref:GAF and ANTAR domain-containing protein n=1 Tax=Actinosynnema sp. NPDC020468 TaxID=3154488 RepID=UPI0033F09976
MSNHNGDAADDARRAWLWQLVREEAAAEGVAVGTRHLCVVATSVLGASAVIVYQVVDGVRSEPVAVSGPTADQVSEAEVTFGEGPAVDALRDEYPVLVADLRSGSAGERWPVFAPFALTHGVFSVSAYPVMMGAIVVGCLEVYRDVAGAATPGQIVDGLLLADAAMLLLLRAGPSGVGEDPFADAVEVRWATVHQATGVASVQLRSDLATAFVRLRAHAYRTGTRLADVAADVLAHRLMFHTDLDDEPDTESESEQG